MENLEKQIREQFHKAFDDVLTESLKKEEPDWDWLVRLFKELRDRLCALTPHRRDLHIEIYEGMDVELFEQMVKNNAFDAVSMWKLVNFVFGRLKDLESPARNKVTDTKLSELYAEFTKPDTILATFVPIFIKEAHEKINQIEKDKKEFISSLKKLCSS